MRDREDATDSTWSSVVGVAIVGVALVYGAAHWPSLLLTTGLAAHLPFKGSEENALPLHPFAELLKLIVAALVGIVVTTVHKRYHRDKPLTRSLMQAQVLLCVAGAMVMIIIGSSVARAFGVAGAAGIVRFRTPVEDPKDSTILFLLVGLGMACGVGLLEVAGLGTVFLCVVLVVLDHFGEARARQMVLSVVAAGSTFPNDHVNRVLGANVDFYEAREVLHGSEAVVRYNVTMSPTASLVWLNQQLMDEGRAGLKSVSWAEPSKKG